MFQKEKKENVKASIPVLNESMLTFLKRENMKRKTYQARAFFILLDELVVSKVQPEGQ